MNHDPQYPDIRSDGLRIPILFGYTDGSGEALRVWCRYCSRYHVHGATRVVGGGDGHRIAHCICEDSPYLITGYIVIELDYPLPDPEKRYKLKYGRDGSITSGFLAARKRSQAKS